MNTAFFAVTRKSFSSFLVHFFYNAPFLPFHLIFGNFRFGQIFFAAIFRPEKFRQRTEKVSASIRIFLPEIGDGLIRSSVTLKRLKQIRTLNSSDPNSSFLSVCSDLRPLLRKTPAEATVLNFSFGFKIESLPVFEPQPPFRLDLENLVSKSSNLQLFFAALM